MRGDEDASPLRLELPGELAIQDVVVASVANRVVGAIVSHPAEGRVGWLWPPVVREIEQPAVTPALIMRHLIAAGTVALAEAGCKLAQALLVPGDPRGRDFEALRFVFLAEMIRMERDCRSRSDFAHKLDDIQFIAYDQKNEREFEAVIEQTYLESQDCPELDELRTVGEALASYKVAGTFRPDLWLLARRGGEWVGCVLLAHSPADQTCELQYMGVVPRARGRQIGRVLCERALADASRIGADTLFLSVDSRNRAAINHYRAMKFIETQRRAVYIRKLPVAGGASGA
jgi:ribosomal protein S18 acetylase RimI-like enzyme